MYLFAKIKNNEEIDFDEMKQDFKCQYDYTQFVHKCQFNNQDLFVWVLSNYAFATNRLEIMLNSVRVGIKDSSSIQLLLSIGIMNHPIQIFDECTDPSLRTSVPRRFLSEGHLEGHEGYLEMFYYMITHEMVTIDYLHFLLTKYAHNQEIKEYHDEHWPLYLEEINTRHFESCIINKSLESFFDASIEQKDKYNICTFNTKWTFCQVICNFLNSFITLQIVFCDNIPKFIYLDFQKSIFIFRNQLSKEQAIDLFLDILYDHIYLNDFFSNDCEKVSSIRMY